MRVPIRWGAPAGLLALAVTTTGCLGQISAGVFDWLDSTLWKPEPGETRSHPSSSFEPDFYVVRPGDTLGDIAWFYGISTDALARANGIVDADAIAVGERLVIPRPGDPQVAAAPPARTQRAAFRPPRAQPASETKRSALDARLRTADELLRTARFDEALAETERARPDLAALEARSGPGTEASAQRVRLEVLAATACIALGREEAARQSFERALRADADLELDPARTPPKVVRGLAETRRRLAAAPANAAEPVAERSPSR